MNFSGYITPDEIRVKLLPYQERQLTHPGSGYGAKIPTMDMARIGKRWYRIYCMIYSNSGTCYIVKNKLKMIVNYAGV